jgi:hypothetical protein
VDEERTFLAHAQTDAHDPLRKWSVHCCGRTIPPQESGFIFEDEVYFDVSMATPQRQALRRNVRGLGKIAAFKCLSMLHARSFRFSMTRL